MCTRGHWRPAEDEKLRELVERYGPHNWNAIAEKLQGRSGARLILASVSIEFTTAMQEFLFFIQYMHGL